MKPKFQIIAPNDDPIRELRIFLPNDKSFFQSFYTGLWSFDRQLIGYDDEAVVPLPAIAFEWYGKDPSRPHVFVYKSKRGVLEVKKQISHVIRQKLNDVFWSYTWGAPLRRYDPTSVEEDISLPYDLSEFSP